MKIGDVYIWKADGTRFVVKDIREIDEYSLNPDMSTKAIIGRDTFVWFDLEGSTISGTFIRKSEVRKLMKKEVKKNG